MATAPTVLLAFIVVTNWSPNMLIILGLTAVTAVMAWKASRPAIDLRRLDLSALRTSAGRRWIGRRLISGLALGLTLGLVIEFTFGFNFGSTFGLRVQQVPMLGNISGFTQGPAFGLLLGLVGALTFGLATHPSTIDHPARLVREGILHTVAVIVAFGLTFGLTFGFTLRLALAFTYEPAGGLVLGLKGGLIFAAVGIVLGLLFVANSPWPRYLVATIILARRGELPRRPAVFLDWAYEAGLMRLSGIGVQFRHREFQTWLTIHDQSSRRPRHHEVSAGQTVTDGEQNIAQTSHQ